MTKLLRLLRELREFRPGVGEEEVWHVVTIGLMAVMVFFCCVASIVAPMLVE